MGTGKGCCSMVGGPVPRAPSSRSKALQGASTLTQPPTWSLLALGQSGSPSVTAAVTTLLCSEKWLVSSGLPRSRALSYCPPLCLPPEGTWPQAPKGPSFGSGTEAGNSGQMDESAQPASRAIVSTSTHLERPRAAPPAPPPPVQISPGWTQGPGSRCRRKRTSRL